MGWPTTDDPKTEHVTLRMTVSEKAELVADASTAGMQPGPFLRDCYRRVRAAEARKAERLRAGETSGD